MNISGKYHRLVSFFLSFLLLFQTFAPTIAFAADEIIDPTPTPTEELTPTPEITPETTPSPEVTPAPSDTSDDQSSQPASTDQPTSESQPTPTPTEELTPTPTTEPTPTPTPEPETPVLAATTTSLFGSIFTDKLDYFPTDTVNINGAGFAPFQTYSIVISSSDDPAISSEGVIFTDGAGSFTYSYQLDGNYRPNYQIVIKDQWGNVVATSSFTDNASYTVESYSDNTYITEKNEFYRGEAVYGKGTRSNSDNIRLIFRNPSNTIVKTCTSVYSTSTVCSYDLPSNAPLGEWDIIIQKKSGGNWDDEKTDHFDVEVDICHATESNSNPFNKLTVDDDAILNHHGHDDHDDDIIPPFYYYDHGDSRYYSGKNWDSEGRTTWENGCVPLPQIGTLIVQKVVDNTNGGSLRAFDFSFSVNGGQAIAFEADGQNDLTVNAGTYTVTEPAITGYITTYQNCSQVSVANGGSATCTITNTSQKGSLIIIKNTFGGDGSFNFDINGPTLLSTSVVTINGSGTVTNPVNAGSYTVTEVVPSGWSLTSSDCQGSLTIDPGTSKTCTFSNTRYGMISGYKYKTDAQGNTLAPLADWLITLYLEGTPVANQPTSILGLFSFIDLLPGNYTLTEESVPGWTQIYSPALINLAVGEGSPDNNFGNFDNGYISGYKYETGTENTLNGWVIRLSLKDSETTPNCPGPGVVNGRYCEYTTGIEDTNGHYIFRDLGPGTYIIEEVGQDGWIQTSPSDPANYEVEMTSNGAKSGQNFSNFKLGSVSGYKWNDANGNHEWDCNNNDGEDSQNCENKLSNWTIYLKTYDNEEEEWNTTATDVTDGEGNYNFDNLEPGDYQVCEENPPGWTQTYPGGNGNCHEITVTSDQDASANFGNQFINPHLSLTKENDASDDRTPGGSTNFTLTLTVLDNDVNDIVVRDLPAKGFKYHAGSWSAKKNGLPFPVPEPVYHSPGDWDLGNLNMGDVVELTYLADIDSSLTPGLYADLAWAKGSDALGGLVLANASTDYFVGSEVNVIKDTQDTPTMEVEKKETVTGSVLGASTSLPATGADTRWLYLAIILGLLGTTASAAGIILKKKYE